MTPKLWADLVIVGCRGIRGHGAGTERTSLGVKCGRIIFIGSDADARALAGPTTRVLDATGKFLAPAFVDSHTHFHRASVMEHLYLNFERLEPRSIDDVLGLVRARAAATPADSWIQGDSLDASLLKEGRLPNRRELDAAAPGRCVVLRTIGRHALSASSNALAAAGIDAETAAPSGGRIEREGDGAPTGVLHEHGKLRLDMTRGDTVVPRPTDADRRAALEEGMRRLAAHGIASIHDIVREPIEIADYIELNNADRLKLRIRMYVRGRESQTPLEYLSGLGLRPGLGDDRLRLAGVKLSIDGDLANRNAAVYEPYPDEPGNRGLLRLTQQELDEAVLHCHKAGFPVAVHAIGPRAVDMALDAIERAQRNVSANRLRHRVEHAFFAQRDGRLQRFADLGVVWSPQISMLYSNGDAWLDAAGEEFLVGAIPLRTARDLGVSVQINSDYPCSPLDPFIGLKAAVDRTTRSGQVLAAEEAITTAEAMSLMTTAPASTVGESRVSGSVDVGKYADLVLLSTDPTSVAPRELLDVRVEATVMGGEVVYERER
ncbi:MAG: imidazolonepropionase [Sphaerisporangium sp.]|nr:imidazolonepropionase [Sphaerisporangium sp.]